MHNESTTLPSTSIPVGENISILRQAPNGAVEDRDTTIEDISEGVVEVTNNENFNEQDTESHNTETHDDESVQDIDEQEQLQPPTQQDSRIITTTRSGRNIRMPVRYNDYVALPVVPGTDNYQYWLHQQPHALYTRTSNDSKRVATDQDTMYLHQALKSPDRIEFIRAMGKEIQSHVANKNWILILRSDVPPGKSILPAVWAMRRKRDKETRQVYKCKARLNIHGGKQLKALTTGKPMKRSGHLSDSSCYLQHYMDGLRTNLISY
jgi:hypothetical protein